MKKAAIATNKFARRDIPTDGAVVDGQLAVSAVVDTAVGIGAPISGHGGVPANGVVVYSQQPIVEDTGARIH